MVFVAGPRQVGKTTLAKRLTAAKAGYLNWDVAEHRERILRRELPAAKLWVFDELHKYRSWRNYLKGLFDNRRAGQQILVTGSARLDFYRFGGDSLQGRYHLLRLHPLSVAELSLTTPADFLDLLKLGGFPEPYFTGSETEARRWSREHRTLLIREEVATLERVQDLGNLELLMLRLPELVGSPLSINAVREDLQVTHKTVANWLQILERLYAIYRLSPFGAPRIRAVKKEQCAATIRSAGRVASAENVTSVRRRRTHRSGLVSPFCSARGGAAAERPVPVVVSVIALEREWGPA